MIGEDAQGNCDLDEWSLGVVRKGNFLAHAYEGKEYGESLLGGPFRDCTDGGDWVDDANGAEAVWSRSSGEEGFVVWVEGMAKDLECGAKVTDDGANVGP